MFIWLIKQILELAKRKILGGVKIQYRDLLAVFQNHGLAKKPVLENEALGKLGNLTLV